MALSGRGNFRLIVAALVAATAVLGLDPQARAQNAAAQPVAASIDEQLDRADRLKEAKNFREAAPLYDAALAAARERATDDVIARALLGRADLYLLLRQWKPGIQDAREALSICDRLDLRLGAARASLLIGAFEAGLGNVPGAIEQFKRALALYTALGDHANAARAGFRLTGVMPDGAESERVLLGVIEDARAAGNRELEGDAYHRLGDDYFNVDKFEEAMTALQAAAAIYESTGSAAWLGTVHNSMGRVYRAHGRLDQALREQKTALEMHRTSGSRVQLLQSLNAVGVTYQRMGYFEEARDYLDQALAVAPSAVDQAPNARDFIEANLGGLLVEVGEYEKAVPILEGVIARGKDNFPGLRWGLLAEAYLGLNQLPQAMKAATEGIIQCGTAKENCARAHGLMGKVQAAMGNRQAARAEAQTALELIEELRSQLLPSDEFRREFLTGGFRFVYSNLIGLALNGGDAAGSLEAAERARARSFIDLLESRAHQTAEASASSAAVMRSASAASVADLIATTARLQSTLVAFWVGNDETFVWVGDRAGHIRSKRITVSRSTLLKLVRDTKPFDVDASSRKPFPLMTRGSAPLSLTQGDAAWRQLYTLLIAPIRPWLPSTSGALLTIIPDDVLNGLSFAAMKGPDGRYLLEDYTLHYAPAGALFQFTEKLRRPDARAGSMLLVSDPALPKQSALDEALPRLPGTRAESKAIAGVMHGPMLLQDTMASESKVRELAPGRSVLHFATHAIVREDKPFESQLVLARSGSNSTADGSLTAEEVYAMRLQADLVVLSACRSAAGAVPGDAISTFTRAFLYAGTASLIASLWDVADQPTTQLIPTFYREWTRGAGKATALRRAQLKLLSDLRAGSVTVTTPLGPVPLPEHPAFWAGFVLFGEPR